MARLLALIVSGWFAFGCAALHAADKFTLKTGEDRIRVEIDGQLFTEYVFKGHFKPILYPIIGPTGQPLTRNYPMQAGLKGEPQDHPHHKSLWFTHGEVNGVDFWAEYGKDNKPDPKTFGQEIQQKIVQAKGGDRGVIQTENNWVAPDGTLVLSDNRTIGFEAGPGVRVIDYDITLTAAAKDVVMGDTKEGSMGIRTIPELQLKSDEKKGIIAKGSAVNSDGLPGKDMWGKRAKWVDYWGPVGGKTVGVAIFDHPSNINHPTWWHARDYGLIAANPFGKSSYEGGGKKPKGKEAEAKAESGAVTIKAGQSLRLRYRFVFHEGDAAGAKIAESYAQWAGK